MASLTGLASSRRTGSRTEGCQEIEVRIAMEHVHVL